MDADAGSRLPTRYGGLGMNISSRGQVVDDLREKIKTYIDRVNDRGFSRKSSSQTREAQAYLELTKALMRALPFDWQPIETMPEYVIATSENRDDIIVVVEDKVSGKRWLERAYKMGGEIHSGEEEGRSIGFYDTALAWSRMPSSKELGGQ